MSEVSVVLRDADGIRKAEVTLPRTALGGDIVQAAIDKWKLAPEEVYRLVNITLGDRLVHEGDALTEALVRNGDVLQLEPVTQAA